MGVLLILSPPQHHQALIIQLLHQIGHQLHDPLQFQLQQSVGLGKEEWGLMPLLVTLPVMFEEFLHQLIVLTKNHPDHTVHVDTIQLMVVH